MYDGAFAILVDQEDCLSPRRRHADDVVGTNTQFPKRVVGGIAAFVCSDARNNLHIMPCEGQCSGGSGPAAAKSARNFALKRVGWRCKR